jgi:ParB family chromosome partitioning protein
VDEVLPTEMVPRLYSALHKTKRAYVKNFVFLLSILGPTLQWPKAVSRNLGVDVARCLSDNDQVDVLRAQLAGCASPEAQNVILSNFVKRAGQAEVEKAEAKPPKQKFEFFVGETKVTARDGECRLVSELDFANVPKGRLEAAVRAFEQAIKGGVTRR